MACGSQSTAVLLLPSSEPASHLLQGSRGPFQQRKRLLALNERSLSLKAPFGAGEVEGGPGTDVKLCWGLAGKFGGYCSRWHGGSQGRAADPVSRKS